MRQAVQEQRFAIVFDHFYYLKNVYSTSSSSHISEGFSETNATKWKLQYFIYIMCLLHEYHYQMILTYLATWLMTGEKLVGPYNCTFCRAL